MSTSPQGSVTLVGGGPGDEKLLTVAAVEALRDADVVLYDRLAPHSTLGDLAPNALLINVGKTPGHHPISQTDIESLLVKHALDGSRVVRLKGGDPFVFGRGAEEVVACRSAGVAVSVIPGVTSAISVPAAAGIPVTARGVTHLFTVVSGHAPLSDDEHRHLAGLGGTVIVLMGVGTLPTLTQGLLAHGASPDLPVAIVERGYSPTQRTTLATLATAVHVASAAAVRSPAVLVIGEVVRFADRDDAGIAQVFATASALAAAE
ncbi:uroporphyrinogen-III C-methyltransferase [Mycetocola zhadangensis]|jgi:uroporphyrin-III C-methyltransferase|uniref:uroporphyrinogen-III C-methyltransferase n=1 Tax=Mycetocola zhadangensis TaxID=1164595 RepID=UPI003A4D5868